MQLEQEITPHLIGMVQGAAVWTVGAFLPAVVLAPLLNRCLQKTCSNVVKMWLKVLFSLRSYVYGHKKLL